VCLDTVIVEVKALAEVTGRERAQVINQLKATSLELGLLIDFGAASLQYERPIRTPRV
jgi:GxxExxY protein